MLKGLRRISAEFKSSEGNDSQLSKDLITAKTLKNEFFDVQNAQERKLFWFELYLKYGLFFNSNNNMTKEILSFLLIQ